MNWKRAIRLQSSPEHPAPIRASGLDNMHPTLVAAQVARIATHGYVWRVERGEDKRVLFMVYSDTDAVIPAADEV